MAVLNTYADITTADGTEEFVVIHAAATKNITSAVLRTYTLGNAFVAFTGPATATKTFTLPDATATILTTNAAVTVGQGGTGRSTSTTAYGLIAAGTTATGALQTLPAGGTGDILVGGGASALPVWTGATGTGAPVRTAAPTLSTPLINTSVNFGSSNISSVASPQNGTAGSTMFGQLHGSALVSSSFLFGNWNTNVAASACLVFSKSLNSTIGTHAAVTNGTTLGRITFEGSDGDEFLLSAAIEAETADNATNGLAKGKLNFLVVDRTGSLKTGAVLTEWGQLRTAAINFTGPALAANVPAKFFVTSATYTDDVTTGSVTVNATVAAIAANSLAATNLSVTYSDASSFYIAGAPNAGTNVTITNRWALYSAANNNALVGNTRIGSGTAPTVALDVTGDVLASAYIKSANATAGIGYGTGAGGTVTQATSRTTGVTLNKVCGTITLFSTTTTAGTFASFTVTNSAVAATDTVVVNFASAATADKYGICVTAVAAGSFRIQIHNIAAVGVAEAPVINFAVIKAVTS